MRRRFTATVHRAPLLPRRGRVVAVAAPCGGVEAKHRRWRGGRSSDSAVAAQARHRRCARAGQGHSRRGHSGGSGREPSLLSSGVTNGPQSRGERAAVVADSIRMRRARSTAKPGGGRHSSSSLHSQRVGRSDVVPTREHSGRTLSHYIWRTGRCLQSSRSRYRPPLQRFGPVSGSAGPDIGPRCG